MTEKLITLIHQWPKTIPGCYEVLDTIADQGGDWPSFCKVPLDATMVPFSNFDRLTALQSAAEMTACWLWRKNKVIYRFDSELAKTLIDQTVMEENLPTELLMHLPYPCVYIRTAELMDGLDGFFYWLNYDLRKKAVELSILWVAQDSTSFYQMLHLLPDATIYDCVADTFPMIKDDTKIQEFFGNPVLKAIQLMLYLVAENSDVSVVSPGKRRKFISDSPSEIRTYNVGVRIGGTIRKGKRYLPSEDKGSGTSKRPHSRRGHWHHFWTGPRDGDRELPEVGRSYFHTL